ncbi:DUF6328 family protein [Microbacterium sp. ET2]|uniref:DUF6328 family protein n=1 Tax=Microbacterium albipurpureum TaxID=3050384 RepID=UPI00259C748A|nr:DUF6328 family protein [Microbacterium sp. ET2 (Ac-2212)]WJL95912.1 DUF6328 family protein [Microbacterium sp. ET2 (Ac-2212)]
MPAAPEDVVDDRVDGRDESPTQRADRNWNEALQELRVLQTGTQILTGFLLALAFQPSFADLSGPQRGFYLLLVVLSALSAIIALAPVALHRVLFAQGLKATVVRFGHGALLTALTIVALLLSGVVAFVFDVVLGTAWAAVAAAGLVLLVIVLWVVVPAVIRLRHRAAVDPPPDGRTP